MLCQKCKQNEATLHYTQVINGKKTEQHLCSSCAKEENLDGLFDINPFSLNPFEFGSLFNKKTVPSLEEEKTCPVCSMTAREIKKFGRLGCSECAKVFEEMLVPILNQVHGRHVHTGKLSKNSMEKEKSPLDKLQTELRAAVEREDYETAAALRDKIREIKGN